MIPKSKEGIILYPERSRLNKPTALQFRSHFRLRFQESYRPTWSHENLLKRFLDFSCQLDGNFGKDTKLTVLHEGKRFGVDKAMQRPSPPAKNGSDDRSLWDKTITNHHDLPLVRAFLLDDRWPESGMDVFCLDSLDDQVESQIQAIAKKVGQPFTLTKKASGYSNPIRMTQKANETLFEELKAETHDEWINSQKSPSLLMKAVASVILLPAMVFRAPVMSKLDKFGIKRTKMPEGFASCEQLAVIRSLSQPPFNTAELKKCLWRWNLHANATVFGGLTLAHLAVGTQNLPALQYLKSIGANLNAQDFGGNTLLHTAISFYDPQIPGHTEENLTKIITFLLQQAPDLKTKINQSKKTPLTMAQEKQLSAVVAKIS